MKRINSIIVVALVALVSAFSANAKFGYGPKVGLNVDHLSMSGSVKDNLKDACGITAGFMAEYTAPIIGIGFDISLMYTHMTAKTDYNEKIMQNMLEIPLNLKYKINIPAINEIFRPYIFTGPTLALRLGGNWDDLNWKKGQWGWNVGLGFELIKHLQIGAGYTFGLTDVVKHVDSIESADFKIKNNYWTVTAAWLF